MPRWKLTGGPDLPEGASVNLDAAEVFTEKGRASGIKRGEVLEVLILDQRDRLEDAVKRGHLIIEEVET